MKAVGPTYGVMGEFLSPEETAKAARAMRELGYHDLDAFGPFFNAELCEAIGFKENKMARCVLCGGVAGGLAGYALVFYATALKYPHNIGGRPYNSWPAYIPVIFETIILGATLTGIASLLILNRLPRLSHPVFTAPRFRYATSDHFFLCVRSAGTTFDAEQTRELLGQLSPISVVILRREGDQ